MGTREPDFNGQVTVVNARGEKQQVPAHWMDHEELSRGFRWPPSAGEDPDADPPAPRTRRGARTTTPDTDGTPPPAEPPATGDDEGEQ